MCLEQKQERAALAGDGTVTFACSGVITLTETITIAADTTIDGSGQEVTISGSDAVRVLTVNEGVTLFLHRLTLSKGSAMYGGGIHNHGSAFTPLPYNKPEAEIAEFAGSFLSQFDRHAYRFVAALENNSDRLVGFAYGYSSRAGQWWYEHASRVLPELAGTSWLEDSFQLVEIALLAELQGQGIGGRMHDHLLAGIQHDRAILATLQAETAACRLYRSRGWAVLGENLLLPGIMRRYQVMGLELSTKRD